MNIFNDLNFSPNADQDGGLRKINKFKVSSKNYPLISIITAVYNNEKYLKECLNSIYNQSYKNFEHIIIDGGSTDKTLNILKKYNNKIDYWCSKKDKGIYDAFNLGMKLSKGDIICFVNSDDQFYSDKTLYYAHRAFKQNEIDFIFGPVKKHWGLLYGYKPHKIYWSWGFYSSHSTGFFIKRNSAKIVGLYNLKYKYSSDYDYFYRMIVKKKLKGIGTSKKHIYGIFRRGGFSSKVKFLDHFKEELKIRYDNNQNLLLIFFIFIYKSIKHFKKIIKGV